MIGRSTTRAFLAAAFFASLVAAATAARGAERYYTTGVLEPDKVASAWLIRRHVVPGSEVLLLPEGTEAPAGAVSFDLPESVWARRATRSCFEVILADRALDDPGLVAIGNLVRTGEIAYWLLEPDSPAGRFDRAMKDYALADDIDGAFAYLDRIYERGGEVPQHATETPAEKPGDGGDP